MKDNLRIWPMKALAALALACGLFPVPVLLGRWLFPDSSLFWWFPFALTFLWGVGGYLLPKKVRVYWTVGGCVSAIGLLGVLSGVHSLPLAVPCIVLLILLPPAWARPVWEEWSATFWIIGVALHLMGQALASRPPFSGTQGLLMGVFLGYAFLTLMYLNRGGIRDGMHGAEKAPAPLRHRNTILVSGLFLIAAAASAWSTLAQWLDAAWYYIRVVIASVVAFFMRLLPEVSQGSGAPGGGMEDFGGFGETAEPSAFALFMEKVFYVVAILLAVVLFFLALRFLLRKLIRLWKKILERMRAYAAAANEDYVDEAESTLNWDEKTQSIQDWVKEKMQKAQKQPKWEELDGRGRVRRLYQQYIRRRPDAQGQTVREAIHHDTRLSPAVAETFTSLYERARYSDHEISTRDADDLKKQL